MEEILRFSLTERIMEHVPSLHVYKLSYKQARITIVFVS